MTQYSQIQTEHQGEWLTIWLNRPEVRNALSQELVQELTHLLDQVAEDTAIRGVTLRGRGGVFCAGGDLKAFKALASAGDEAYRLAREMSLSAAALFARLRSLPQLTLVIVEGAAMAGGMGLACAADLVVTHAKARFALTETRIGQSPAQIAPYIVAKLGLARARRLMLLASEFDGSEAERYGLADVLVPSPAQFPQVESGIRQQVLRCSPAALAATKTIIEATAHLEPAAMRAFAAEHFARCLVSEQGQEGFNAFLEKRRPNWSP